MKEVQIKADIRPLLSFVDELKQSLEHSLDVPDELVNRFLSILETSDELVSIKGDLTSGGAKELLVTVDATDGFRELLGALRALNIE